MRQPEQKLRLCRFYVDYAVGEQLKQLGQAQKGLEKQIKTETTQFRGLCRGAAFYLGV